MKQLPPNCEIDIVDHDERLARLVFWGDDPYYSDEFSYTEPGGAHDAAVEYCERFGWLEDWPNKCVDRDGLLDELESLCEEAISAIESNPEAFSNSFDECWDWFEEQGPGRYGDDLDTESVPSEDDGKWVENDYKMVYVINDDGSKCIEFHDYDGCDWEQTAEYDEECHDFRYDMATTGCEYHCLKCDLYSVYIAKTGEDPLGTIMPIKQEVHGVCTVTIDKEGVRFDRKLEPVPDCAKDFIKSWLGDTPREDLIEIGAEVGVINKEGHEVQEWRLDEMSADKIVIKLKYKVKTNAPSQADHDKEVAFRGLEARVRKAHASVMNKLKEVQK